LCPNTSQLTFNKNKKCSKRTRRHSRPPFEAAEPPFEAAEPPFNSVWYSSSGSQFISLHFGSRDDIKGNDNGDCNEDVILHKQASRFNPASLRPRLLNVQYESGNTNGNDKANEKDKCNGIGWSGKYFYLSPKDSLLSLTCTGTAGFKEHNCTSFRLVATNTTFFQSHPCAPPQF